VRIALSSTLLVNGLAKLRIPGLLETTLLLALDGEESRCTWDERCEWTEQVRLNEVRLVTG
jgi:hypothetical protein